MLRATSQRLFQIVALVALTASGCRCQPASTLESKTCGPDVQAPEPRELKRYAVDELRLPQRRTDFADDLDGDGRADNQLGNLVALAAAAGYTPSSAAARMLGAGAIAPEIELWGSGDRAAVRFRDAHGDAVVGGQLIDGSFTSNRTRCTRSPVQLHVRLPILPDADPIALALEGVEIDANTDGGGLRVIVRGAVKADEYERVAHASIVAMIRNRPVEHRTVLRVLDADHDGVVSFEELRRSPLLSAIARPDLRLHDAAGAWAPSGKRDAGVAPDALSIAFEVHARPCPNGDCAALRPPVAPACDDRVKNGRESDTDCGGDCPPCAGGAVCTSSADCQSARCDGGKCAEPSCRDGRTDAAESDVDCGGACAPCAAGRACRDGDDCAGACLTGRCATCRSDGDCRALGRTTCTLGLCLPPSCLNGKRDGRESDIDCGGGDCPRCGDGKACRDEADCSGGECENFRCADRDEERERGRHE